MECHCTSVSRFKDQNGIKTKQSTTPLPLNLNMTCEEKFRMNCKIYITKIYIAKHCVQKVKGYQTEFTNRISICRTGLHVISIEKH